MGSPNGNDLGYDSVIKLVTPLWLIPYVTGYLTTIRSLLLLIELLRRYNCSASDTATANATLANGLIGPNNRLYPESTTIDILQYQQPYAFPDTDPANVFELKYSYLGPVLASPLFNQYQISTVEEVFDTATAVAPLEKLHFSVCQEVRQAVTAYYLVRDFDFANTALINTKLFDANQAAVAGQLINTYDAVVNTPSDDGAPEGTNGEVLFPQVLKDNLLQTLELWMATLPDN